MPRLTLNVITRQLVLASVLAALYVGHVFMRGETRWLMLASFALAAGVSLISRRSSTILVLGSAFIAPALIVLGLGFYYGPEAFVWLSALAGLVVVRSWREPWAVPPPLRWPLITWALTVAVTWPVVFLREANFSPALMAADSRFAGAVWIAASWIATVALNHLLGLLWIDWLFRECGRDGVAFERDVAAPLTVSFLITIAFGLYQAFFDIGFANGGAHLGLGRASGGLMDANPFGAVVALWGPIVYAIAVRRGGRWGQPLGMGALVLSWCGMWVSGSRGAFGTAVIGLLAVAIAEIAGDARRRRWTIAMLAVAVGVVAVAAYALPVANSPIHRLAPLARGLGDVPLSTWLSERWDPYFYGRTAWRALMDSPLFGIGLGTFQSVVGSYSVLLGHPPLLVDNAQNWFRHQLTELGLFGSIGWAIWIVCATALILSPASDRRAAWIARGVLLASAAASLIGMPGQNVAVVLVFWACVFFAWQQVIPRWPRLLMALDRATWMPLVIALVCAGGTAYVGRQTLMPALRAARFNEYYAFGTSQFAEQNGRGEFTLVDRHALAVVHPTSKLLKLTVSMVDPQGQGADVRVAVDRHVLVSGRVTGADTVEYLTLRDSSPGVVLEAGSNATVPAGGVRIRWESLASPR